jgi:hypothetical protein
MLAGLVHGAAGLHRHQVTQVESQCSRELCNQRSASPICISSSNTQLHQLKQTMTITTVQQYSPSMLCSAANQ